MSGDSEVKQEIKESMDQDVSQANAIRQDVMQNPGVLAALQQQLESMVGKNSGYVETLPKKVQRRIKALKNLQKTTCDLECQFYKDVHALEHKYNKLFEPTHSKRQEIIAGRYEPNDDECQWESEAEDKEDDAAEDEVNQIAKKVDEVKLDENVAGIPSFWLTIFKSCPILQEMVQENDEPLFEMLEDIKVNVSAPEAPEMYFELEFHFAENDYFTDKVLRKKYLLQSEPEQDEPFSYEGPEIKSTTGCQINWKEGKNLTVKTVKKKQKHKNKGTVRTVTKEVPADSFFNFFDPPAVEDEDEMDDDMEALLSTDYEIGHLLRERIVPRAVLFFTGDDEYDDEEEESDEGEEYSEDGESGEDADYDPKKDAKATPQECNQQ